MFFNMAIPTQGCTLEDRAVLDESLAGAKIMMSILLASMMSQKGLTIRVEGCTNNRPNIIKVLIHN